MPKLPQTASLHVIAAGAQRTAEGVRLLCRFQECPPVAIVFSPEIAAEIGFNMPGLITQDRVRKTMRPYHRLGRTPGAVTGGSAAIYGKVAALIASTGVSVIEACNAQEPPANPDRFYSWRNYQKKLQAKKAAAASATTH